MSKLIEKSQIYYNYALQHMYDNQISIAHEILLKSINLYSKDIETLNLLGLACYLLCDFNNAKYYWDISKSIVKENNRALSYLSELESDRFKLLIGKYNKAIDYIELLDYKEAIKELKSIVDDEEDLIEPYAIIGLCYFALDEHAVAKSYIEKALNKDNNNERYLQYLAEINEIIINSKPKSSYNNKVLISIMALLILAFATLYFNEQSKYTQDFNKNTDYKQKYDNLNIVLNNKETDLSLLEDKLTIEQNKNKDISDRIDYSEYEKKYISKNEQNLFDEAYDNLYNDNYEEAIEQFNFIVRRGIEENIVAESLYFLSVSYERNADYYNACKHYEEYIHKFYDRNYYDDSLYNYGLLLYKQGDVSLSIEVLKKIKTEIPNSIFNNTKVDYILSN